MIHKFLRILYLLMAFFLGVLMVQRDVLEPGNVVEQVRRFTRQNEFDFIRWTGNALGIKLKQAALGLPNYLPVEEQTRLVRESLSLVREILETEQQLEIIFADPNVVDKETAAQPLRIQLAQLQNRYSTLGPLSESILQQQVSEAVQALGIGTWGLTLPPVLYHVTPLPDALIVSPRSEIRQDANISLDPDLSLDEIIHLENQVQSQLGQSALVVPVGGIGVYPTMVMQTTNLPFLADTVAHEWIHNYLTLKPLGVNYMTSPDLRTMNETTASIAGEEIGQWVLAQYYPDLLPPPPPPAEQTEEPAAPMPSPEPPPFNYRAEMRETRVTVDALLAAGKIKEAEEYMEARRRIFWDQGYLIRKLNQAYFAFYGAYADQPGGAAGEDPVGPAVRKLREQSRSLSEFLETIGQMTSFEELQRAVGAANPG